MDESVRQINYTNNEITLLDLIQFLWKQRFVILTCMSVTMGIGIIHLIRIQPVYEAKAYVIQPTIKNIAELNYFSSPTKSVIYFNIVSVFNTVVDLLNAENTKRYIFNNEYLPSLSETISLRAFKETLYQVFTHQLTIKDLSKDELPHNKRFLLRFTKKRNKVIVTYRNKDPFLAKKILKQYLKFTDLSAKNEIIDTIEARNSIKIHRLERKIKSAKDVAKIRKQDRLVQLNEALQLAHAIGLKNQELMLRKGAIIDMTKISKEPSLMYLRGVKTLESEIKNLSERTSNNAFTPGLRKLQKKYMLYKSLQIDRKGLTVFRLDGPIQISKIPIKRYALVVVFTAALIGLFLSVILTLGQHALKKLR